MSIYDEAVVDAQKLREVAENAAKQQILEAITPRIRDMINSRILNEQEGQELDIDVEDADDESAEMTDEAPADNVIQAVPVSSAPHEEESSSPVVIHNTGDIHIESDSDDDENVLTDQMAESLARMIKNEKAQRALKKRVENLTENYRLFKEAATRLVKSGKATSGQKRKIRDTYKTLAQEAIAIRGELQANGGGSQRLEGKLVETIKEMRTMSTKTKRNIFDFLFESEDEDKKKESRHMDEAELSLSLDDEEKAQLADKSEDEIDDALAGVLGDISFDLGADDEPADDAGDDEPADDAGDDEPADDTGDDEPADDAGDDDSGDDLDLGEMDKMGMGEGEVVYEIDEAALRRELGKMKNLRESRELKARKLREARARRAKMVREQAETQIDQFGGAEEIGDVFYDVDEDSLINVLADELGSVSEKGMKESRYRAALKEAAEYRKAAESLKGQLVEMNLFNAKLLYANKLMQNKDLTVKQQRAIVEALDNAKTLREAKLLYKSLSESLARRTQKAGTMSESVNRTVLGSSSRSTRSAQPASSGVEVDRWAVLAGLPEGK